MPCPTLSTPTKRKYVKKPRILAPDEGKICQVCETRFFKREGERDCYYVERATCGGGCARVLQGIKKTLGAAYVDPRFITCLSCAWEKENSDFGKHCGVCESGDMFRGKSR